MTQETPVQSTLWCSQCGRELAPSDLVQIAGSMVCAECKPAFLSRVMASGAAVGSRAAWHYGGFWIRFGARFIDGLVFILPTMVFVFAVLLPNLPQVRGQADNPFGGAVTPVAILSFFALSFIAGGCYEILMLKYRSATLGKMACGLKVIKPEGGSLSWGVCFGRFFMWNVVTSGVPYLNSIIMLVSSIMLATDDEKRALHDRVCDTRVIYK